MFASRLPSKTRVDALIRGLAQRDINTYVRAKGDAERGDLLLLVEGLDGYQPFTKMLQDNGKEAWGAIADTPLDPLATLDLVAKRRSFDPDLWVLDIEARGIDIDLTDDLFCAVL